MERCEDFEIGIEMRLHGALDVPQTDSLVAHLATCASCRAFEDLAKGSENAMNEQTILHVQTLDWDGLWKRTRSFIDTDMRHRIVSSAVVILALTPPMMLIENEGPGSAVVRTLTLWAVAIAVLMLRWRRKLAAVAKYEGDTGELLFFYRRELEDRLRATRIALVLLPVWPALLAHRLANPFASARQWVGFAGLGVVVAGALAYVWLVRRPRIVRELRSLKADLQPR